MFSIVSDDMSALTDIFFLIEKILWHVLLISYDLKIVLQLMNVTQCSCMWNTNKELGNFYFIRFVNELSIFIVHSLLNAQIEEKKQVTKMVRHKATCCLVDSLLNYLTYHSAHCFVVALYPLQGFLSEIQSIYRHHYCLVHAVGLL